MIENRGFRLGALSLLVVLLVLIIVGNLFWLKLVASMLTLAGAVVGIVSKTLGEQGLTKSGKLLLSLTLISGSIGLIAGFLEHEQKVQDAAKAREVEAKIQSDATAARKEGEKANDALKATRGQLTTQISISATLSRELQVVREELARERTPLHSVEVRVRFWIRPTTDCFQQLLEKSSKRRKRGFDDDLFLPGRGPSLKSGPSISAMNEQCASELEGFLDVLEISGYLSSNGIDVKRREVFREPDLNYHWHFREFVSISLFERDFYWNESEKRIEIELDQRVSEEKLERVDGARLSFLDFSGKILEVVARIPGPPFGSTNQAGDFGIPCVEVSLEQKRRRRFFFGVGRTCGKDASPYIRVEEPRETPSDSLRVYSMVFPRTLR